MKNSIYKKTSLRQVYLIALVFIVLSISFLFYSLTIQNVNSILYKVLNELSSTILIVGLITLIQNYISDIRLAESVAQKTAESMRDQINALFYNSEVVVAIKRIYKNRNQINFEEYIKTSKSIDLLATNLDFFSKYEQNLLDKVNDNVLIRILALDPNQPFVKNRFNEVGFHSKKSFNLDLVNSLRNFCERRENLESSKQNKIVIKIYKSPPTLMVYRFDNKIILGFILKQGRSRNYLHIEFNYDENNEYSKCFLSHFEAIWKEAIEINSQLI